MPLGPSLRRQASVCARLADECDDEYFAQRLKQMASDSKAQADEAEGPPSERLHNRYMADLLSVC
jgi:hypothetical protein